MKYRMFGRTDLEISEIGFGAWAIGGPAMAGSIPIGWGPADPAEARAALKKAADRGINFFDTADFYGLGHSETLIGEVFGNDPSIVVATKVGHRLDAQDQIVTDYSRDYIIDACQRSLKRLGRDTIDFYQMHTAKVPDLENGGCIDAMEYLKKTGAIRYWGVSLNTYQPEPEAEYLLEHNLGSGFQLVFNVINQKAGPIMKAAGEKGFGVIVRMPYQFGLLTGKFTKASQFSDNDHRSFRLKPSILDALLPELDPLWKLSEKYQTTPAILSLSYILSMPGTSTVIPGIRNVRQAELNTMDPIHLDPADLEHIGSWYEKRFEKLLDFIQAEESKM